MAANISIIRLFALGFVALAPASAGATVWTDWTSGTAGNPGSASGTAGAIAVNYAGQMLPLSQGFTTWNPASTYVGGVITSAPPSGFGAVYLEGGQAYTETITFSAPVVDPVMAFWSLGGGGGVTAQFVFPANEPISLQAGGPSAEIGGGAISVIGQTVSGNESNGSILISGTFQTLSFTTPVFEHWYGLTVGFQEIPEPASLLVFATALPWLARLRRRRGG